jgi:2-oxoglutarate dehydrogenase E1 component
MRSNDLAANVANVAYLEQLFAQFKQNPDSLPEQWRSFFAGFEVGVGQADRPLAVDDGQMSVNLSVFDLVHSYRELGHHGANLDPLGLVKRSPHPNLELKNFNISESDLDRQVGNGGFQGDTDGTIRDLLAKLQRTYCNTIGVEFTGISNPEQRAWLERRVEQTYNHPKFSPDEQHALLFQLVASEEFEQFLGRTFVGVKRFGVEGAEAFIPLLNTLVDHGAASGGEQFIFCMAHRGRLNTLAHVMNKPFETILGEFAGTNKKPENDLGDGDVKYHLGYANTRPDPSGRMVKISLLPNPSHLELINPIHQGIVRCKQEWLGDVERRKVIPIQIHGDAAFVGQGVVTETLNLSELPGWRTGGTIHVLINNQVGFTTPPVQDRFTPYPTDMAKGIEAPIFHVNGDDPEAVVHIAKLAIEFRQQFQCDVIIDMWCYRRLGHNEADEPAYTQPVMYRRIKEMKTTRQLYAERLIESGSLSAQQHEEMKAEAIRRLSEAREKSKELRVRDKVPKYSGVWSGLRAYNPGVDHWSSDTGVDHAVLEQVISSYERMPPTFTPHPKLVKMIDDRKTSVRQDTGLDWGTAEMLAFGSLVLEGHRVRITGQDVERGTFSHRHAGLNDYETGEVYFPLKNLGPNQASFSARNSMLSEFAVLGFEWGYASSDPRNLVVWEAQFGDFVNGAQPIIDQIISSAESKWRYACGLTMLLPHGYEGAGPEHSNAYLERFLSLFADDNMQVCVPSTPANYFHMLRRQIHRPFRKPLVCFMPKALLRRKETFSRVNDLTGEAKIQLVIDDPRHADKPTDSVKRVLCCSGKVYYTLDAAREQNKIEDVALVRIEQLSPFPQKELQAVLNKYRRTQEVAWVQEEPANRGAWRYIEPLLRQMLPDTLVTYFGREASASPASGSMKASEAEEVQFVGEALELKKRELEGVRQKAAETAKAGQKAVPD